MSKIETLCNGIGKRKTSVAKAFLTPGSGTIILSNKNLEKFFQNIPEEHERIKSPFIVTNSTSMYDAKVNVRGGGIVGQVEAIRLAIAKALCKLDLTYRDSLKAAQLLCRDSRIKERRKYGLKKARKASQYSKR